MLQILPLGLSVLMRSAVVIRQLDFRISICRSGSVPQALASFDAGLSPQDVEGPAQLNRMIMAKIFNIGDHVRWKSEAGRVSGVIAKKITSDTRVKGYVHRASPEAPQYLIKSDKTDHVAVHKGSTLRLVPAREKESPRAQGTARRRKR